MEKLINGVERNHTLESAFYFLDNLLRDEHSFLANSVNRICHLKGPDYLRSKWKRVFDLSFSIPAAIVATPFIISLGILKRREDGGSAFFVHERLNSIPGKTIKIFKVRCMKPNSDAGSDNSEIARNRQPWEDPRNTQLGVFMKKYNLEELPQLYQVVLGQLSLIGIRAAPKYVFDQLKELWSRERYKKWQTAYMSGKLGMTGINQIFGSKSNEEIRYYLDVFYVNNASLGLDLYLLWRQLVQIFGY
jgi:lipopolysaccharide/colanic/teichoic acid biosynthesis glycosyltransferase